MDVIILVFLMELIELMIHLIWLWYEKLESWIL